MNPPGASVGGDRSGSPARLLRLITRVSKDAMTQKPNEAPRAQAHDEDVLTLADIIRFSRRHVLLILGTTLAVPFVALLILTFVVPAKYEASVTLVVMPQTFASELKPLELPVDGYLTLLESGSVIATTVRHLREQEILDGTEALRLGSELETRTSTAPGSEEPPAPTIEAVARGKTAKQAAAIANTWTQVFIEQTHLLLTSSVSPTIELIEQEYRKARDQLESLEQKHLETANQYYKRIDQLELTWDRRLAELKNETEDLIVAYHSETRRAAADLVDSKYLNPTVTDGSSSAAEEPIREELEKKLLQVLALRTQLAQTPRFLILEKSLSDDALWQALARPQAKGYDPGRFVELSLVTEEANPLFDELTLRLSQIEIDLDALSPEERRQAQRFMMELEQHQAERSAGLSKLVAERTLGLQDLKRQRKQKLEALQRERDIHLEQLELDIMIRKEHYDKLARNNEEASLAKAEQDILDVRLSSPAVPPVLPEQRPTILIVIAAVMGGGLLGFLLALVREVGST